ncbi:Permease of the drug/metabolite transporter (DMT) superfamily [Kaistia soli DSM 19436]|uniref:Permease of the drug/metabolite transporter (DMT) superfamily n=1 Tax=Kaistia soli DSM 19436 TaxID=1122133 RepID=A0A1M5FPL9_9HYPH|nr:DMT family transporter [Kaistia soli]SHF93448.1 Permease of the drug/metabolite transporter (DMT) superfamily [Kaistia soli DSM 19436]
MNKGVVLALASYAVFSCADAAIKAAGGRLHVAEMTLILTVFSCLAVFFAKPRQERWGDMLRMQRPGLVVARMCAAVGAGLASAYAFTTLPLADAYSLIFLLPLFVAAFSFFYLRERTNLARLVGLMFGLAGVLLVVRPGFREILPGHLAAVATALLGALSLLMLRVIGRTERQVTLLGTLMLGSLVVNGVITLFVFEWPTMHELMLLALCGLLAGAGHLLIMAATRNAPANRIGPMQYSQIVWAVVLGGLLFDELPDAIALIGIGLVLLSGVLNFLPARSSEAVAAVNGPVPAPRHPES